MAKAENRSAIVRISDPGMEWHEIDLNALRACCQRELAFRERVYRKWVVDGRMKEAKAEKEIELMRQLCGFLEHCIFRWVTKHQPSS